MLCMLPCESFTQNREAPASAAPSMQAYASWAIHERARSYSTPVIITWLQVATPPMPSMSTEIHTLFTDRFGTAADGSGAEESCADGGTRTHTHLREYAPEAYASTNWATSAWNAIVQGHDCAFPSVDQA